MADQRIQFNVRLDKYPALYEALKAKAQEEGLTFNDFAIRAFQQVLGWEVEDNPPVRRSELEEMLAPLQRRLEEIEQRLEESKSPAKNCDSLTLPATKII